MILFVFCDKLFFVFFFEILGRRKQGTRKTKTRMGRETS